MKQKKIESKLTKAKKKLGKATEKVSRLESRLEKTKKSDLAPKGAKPSQGSAPANAAQVATPTVSKPSSASRVKQGPSHANGTASASTRRPRPATKKT